ncbi:MAG: hypothetical protein R3B99_20485 [Polyangiales bacterium]
MESEKTGQPTERAEVARGDSRAGCSTTLWAATSPSSKANCEVYCRRLRRGRADLAFERALHQGRRAYCDDDAERLWEDHRSRARLG